MSLPDFDISSPHTSSSVIYYPAKTFSQSPSSPLKLIYFVTGNPGLIAYYGPFLSTLHSLLSQTKNESHSGEAAEHGNNHSRGTPFAILGTSLANFAPSCLESKSSSPLSLAEQISLSCLRLETLCKRLQSHQSSSPSPIQVYLIGHSVGAYISLSISSVYQSSLNPGLRPASPVFNSAAAILLTPTITDIAISQSGKLFTPLSRFPGFPSIVGIFVGLLTAFVPVGVVAWIIGTVMHLPEHISRPTAEIAKGWGRGVKEALYLARDEMNVIKKSKWDEVIWHVEMKTVCFYVEKDRWVSDQTRDELLAKQLAKESDTRSTWPKIVVDSSGIGHGFCVHHSEVMAEKVASWIEEVVET